MQYDRFKEKIFTFRKRSECLLHRENSWLEFKKSFSWGERAKYAKTMAAFANNKGGFIVFGVHDKTLEVLGINDTKFENVDEEKIVGYLNRTFLGEISFEKSIDKVRGRKICVIAVGQTKRKPVISIVGEDGFRNGAIYYRYIGRNDEINAGELIRVLDNVREIERRAWRQHLERISVIGPENAAIMDTINGLVTGNGGSFLIDGKLLPKLKFIRSGDFTKRGKPALKLIGNLQSVNVVKGKQLKGVRLTDNPNAPAMRLSEDEERKLFPLRYSALLEELKKRYTDFKADPRFHGIKNRLQKDPNLFKPRYLDPSNPRSGKLDWYSKKIIKKFDQHYRRKTKPR